MFRSILALSLLLGVNGCVLSAPGYEGALSDHFDGKNFRNPVMREPSFARFFQWILTRMPGEWNTRSNRKYPKPSPTIDNDRAIFTFVGHATVLIQVDGLNILTDPIWSERASPFSFAGPKRKRPPGVAFDELPKIDVVLISHNHYDHLDVDTLRRLNERDQPLFIAGLGNSLFLKKKGLTRFLDLDWWQEHRVSEKMTIAGVPAQHFSGRGLLDRNKTLWMGYVLKSSVGNFFFAGDTGLGPHFDAIREKFAPIQVALLPIGAFRPEWFMAPVHVSPSEAVKAAEMLAAQKSIGIHFGTFQLADDSQDEPIEKLREALSQTPSGPDFTTLDFGESLEFVPKASRG